MSSLSYIQRSKDSILYAIPPGKPDPNERCIEGEDTRSRVIQSSCKGNSCWYNVFNFLRKRIGKDPVEALQEARRIEKIISSYRKQSDVLYDFQPIPVEILCNEEVNAKLSMLTKSNIKELLLDKSDIDKLPVQEGTALIQAINEFLAQNTDNNFYDFLLNGFTNRYFSMASSFLRNLNLDPNVIIAGEKQSFRSKNISKVTESPTDETLLTLSLFDAYIYKVVAEKYELQRSEWTPLAGYTGLFKELKAGGPLAICGSFGRNAYTEEPFKMDRGIL